MIYAALIEVRGYDDFHRDGGPAIVTYHPFREEIVGGYYNGFDTWIPRETIYPVMSVEEALERKRYTLIEIYPCEGAAQFYNFQGVTNAL